MRKSFTATVCDVVEHDERLQLILGDIGVFGFKQLAEARPQSVLNIGILEQAMVGVAAGMAMDGRIPIVHSIAPFLVERCLEQLKIDFAYQGLSGKFVSVGASFDYAALGCTHHCPADVGTLLGIPDMDIVIPGTGDEFDKLFRSSLYDGRNTYFRLSEFINSQSFPVVLGKATLVRRGTKGTVVAIGPTLDLALQASIGIDVSVVYLTTIAPFDYETLRDATDSYSIYVLEPFYEGTVSHLVSRAFGTKRVSIQGRGVPRQFLEGYGTRHQHMTSIGLDKQTVRSDLERLFL